MDVLPQVLISHDFARVTHIVKASHLIPENSDWLRILYPAIDSAFGARGTNSDPCLQPRYVASKILEINNQKVHYL